MPNFESKNPRAYALVSAGCLCAAVVMAGVMMFNEHDNTGAEALPVDATQDAVRTRPVVPANAPPQGKVKVEQTALRTLR
ncbi:MAG TPA: hypothetical protein VGN52_14815 [Burkholderiales bacterium]|jgi:hypothetical protein